MASSLSPLGIGAVGVLPQIFFLNSDQIASVVTAAGFIQAVAAQEAVNLGTSFIIIAAYSNGSGGVANNIFVPSFSGTVISLIPLAQSEGSVLLNPGHDQEILTGGLAVFSGNLQVGSGAHTGNIFLIDNVGANSFVLQASADMDHNVNFGVGTTYGQEVTVKIPDPGTTSTTNLLLSLGTNQMGASSQLLLDKGTDTENLGAVTINNQSGVITSAALTTAAGAAETITMTNSTITTSSVVLVSLMGGSNTTAGIQLSATAGAGTSSVVIANNNASAAALNGTVIIGFTVL